MMNLKASPMVMKKHRNRSSSSILSCLPQDLLVEVVMQLASKSRTPVNDIRSLRATCKRFYGASMDKLVGRSIAFDKEGRWSGRRRTCISLYFEIVQIAKILMPILFLEWMDELYISRKANSGMQHLKRAMDGGHLTAACFLGIVLFRHPATIETLNKVSTGDVSNTANVTEYTRSGNPIVDRCRKEALKVI